MKGEPTYGELLRRARSHGVSEQDVLSELIRRLTPRMRGIVRRYRLTREDEFDILQDAWLLLMQNLHAVREPDRIVGWLWTTVSREAVKVLNHRRREVFPGDQDLEARVTDQETAAEQVARTDRDRALWRAVDRLPERDRLLAELMAREPGASCARVAQLIGVAPNSVSQLRARCLRRLRRLLAAEGITDAGV